MRAIVVADDDALFPVFVHEDDSDMEVDEAVRQASHLFSNSGVDTTHSATYEQQPPQKQVTDTSGSTWSITNRVLGGGAFATVWLATNEMGRPVAAKIINTSHRNISSSAHEIISEVETLSSMRHPHIVSYLSWAMVGKDMYVFMEWVGYGSLKMMMDQCKVVPIDMVQKYVLHALSGLIFLHSKGIVHCDVKPHNLLVEANGCVKIADFGSVVSCMNRDDRPVIRRYIDPTQPDMTVTDSTHYGPSSNGKDTSEEQQQHQEMAQVGHEDLDVKGTAWYMAPEACRGDVEAVSDVWSLGITVAELLGGQLPFAPQDLSTSQSRFIQRVGSGMIKPTITHIPLLLDLVETYPQLGNFLRECWEFNPRNRHTANKIQDEQTSWTSQ
jgi:serine/threonine protein kinase